MGIENVGLSISKSQKFRIVGKIFAPRDKSPWAIFTTLGVGQGVPCPPYHAKISPSWLSKCGLKSAKSSKYKILWWTSSHRGPIPSSDFFLQNLESSKRESPRSVHPHAKFHHRGYKIWAKDPKSRNFVIFCINLLQRVYPLKRFLQNLVWGRESQFWPSCQILLLWLNKCGLSAQKYRQKW